jgi:hypothetical protein
MTQNLGHRDPEPPGGSALDSNKTIGTQQSSPNLHGISHDHGVPKDLIYFSIVIGLLMVIAGIGLIIAGKPSVSSTLMTCVGFGLLLVAFGSRASGSWGSWSATGAGAMAVLLFLLLQHYSPPQSPMEFSKKGQIRGNFSKVADIRIVDEGPLYEYRDATTGSERFIFLNTALHSKRLSVQVDTTEKGGGKEFFELIGSSKRIADKYFSDTGADASIIQGQFDYEHRTIKDGADLIFAEPDQLDENLLPKATHAAQLALPSLVGSAVAQSAPAPNVETTQETQQGSLNVGAYLADLESDDPMARRNARDGLVAIGVPSVEPMMTALRNEGSNYRLRGGVMYVLSTTITNNPNKKADISTKLKPEDFPILVSAASDDDKTVRLQASEFLYSLGDPRSIPYSVDAAKSTNDNNKASNQITILSQSWKGLPESTQSNIYNDLTKGPGPNNDLMGNHGWLRKQLGVHF